MTTLVWHKWFFSRWTACIESVVLIFVFCHVCTLSCCGLTSRFKKNFRKLWGLCSLHSAVLRTKNNLRAFWNRILPVQSFSSLSRLGTHSSLCSEDTLRNSETLNCSTTIYFKVSYARIFDDERSISTDCSYQAPFHRFPLHDSFYLLPLKCILISDHSIQLGMTPEKVHRERGLCARLEECSSTDSRRCTTI